jgi:hypothetical protein
MRVRRVVLLLLLGACNAAKDCTAIGCIDAVHIQGPQGLPDPSVGTLTVCIEDDCHDTRFGGDGFKEVPAPDLREGDEVTAVMVMPDGTRYESDVKATSNRPNGPECSPVCIDASLTLEQTTT